jgi:hypothetical protein
MGWERQTTDVRTGGTDFSPGAGLRSEAGRGVRMGPQGEEKTNFFPRTPKLAV